MPELQSRRTGKTFGAAALYILSLLPADRASAADVSYEKRISDAIARSVSDGRAVWLNLDQGSFLSIFLEAETRETHGAVLIIPGFLEHADSTGLVRGLRSLFPARGWSAMSLQMPGGNPDRDLKRQLSRLSGSGARIRSAVDYLAAEKIKKFVLIGHGLGAWAAVDYLTANPKPGTLALVLVGMPVFPDNPLFGPQIETLKKIDVPVLDIYGSRDLDSVIDGAGLRREWMKKNQDFRQIEIAGANHEFQSETGLVFKRIYSWVKRNLRPIEAEE